VRRAREGKEARRKRKRIPWETWEWERSHSPRREPDAWKHEGILSPSLPSSVYIHPSSVVFTIPTRDFLPPLPLPSPSPRFLPRRRCRRRRIILTMREISLGNDTERDTRAYRKATQRVYKLREDVLKRRARRRAQKAAGLPETCGLSERELKRLKNTEQNAEGKNKKKLLCSLSLFASYNV